MIEELCERFAFEPSLRAAAMRARERVAEIDYPAQRAVAAAVLHAFAAEGLSESDLAGATGYGYDDAARDRYEALLARIFGAQRALARLSIVSGTHAIVAALSACAPPGTALLSVSGRPYDTLRNAICDAPQSLVALGTHYDEIALLENGDADLATIARALRAKTYAAAFVQRSRGYAPRRSMSIAQLSEAIQTIKAVSPETLVLVDNCYGELVETQEPTHAGAELALGSLIKNLGGALAPGGGYAIGHADVVERVAARVYAPGIAGALGPTLGYGRNFVQGLFQAPLIVEQTLRGLDFAAALFRELGFAVDPKPGEPRTDIVQSIRLETPELLLQFARGLQRAMPLNARFVPEPGAVPGYAEPVVMSSGAFVAGATIELSCDAPMRPPYEVYLQGGVTFAHACLGALCAAAAVVNG